MYALGVTSPSPAPVEGALVDRSGSPLVQALRVYPAHASPTVARREEPARLLAAEAHAAHLLLLDLLLRRGRSGGGRLRREGLVPYPIYGGARASSRGSGGMGRDWWIGDPRRRGGEHRRRRLWRCRRRGGRGSRADADQHNRRDQYETRGFECLGVLQAAAVVREMHLLRVRWGDAVAQKSQLQCRHLQRWRHAQVSAAARGSVFDLEVEGGRVGVHTWSWCVKPPRRRVAERQDGAHVNSKKLAN